MLRPPGLCVAKILTAIGAILDVAVDARALVRIDPVCKIAGEGLVGDVLIFAQETAASSMISCFASASMDAIAPTGSVI